MIYTDLENLKHYQGINKNLDTAIRYLIEKGTENLVPGRNDVDGDNVFVNEFSYMTIPESEAIFEAHFDYADVHIDRKSTRLNSSHMPKSRMPSSA